MKPKSIISDNPEYSEAYIDINLYFVKFFRPFVYKHLTLYYKYRAYVFKKVGDFLILKRHNRYK